MFEVNDRRYSGIAIGVVNYICFAGTTAVSVVMGKIFNAFKNAPLIGSQKAYFILILLVAVSAAGSFFMHEINATNVYKGK